MSTNRKGPGRLLAGVISLAAAAGIGVVGGTITAIVDQPTAAHAASVLNGKITRAEVMTRARDWFNRSPGLTYSHNADTYGIGNDERYRRDCSGFVDMAWHISTDEYTGNLANISILLSSNPSSSTNLRPGDILNNASDGHVVLFDKWEADHVHFSYYSFGATPMVHRTHASFSDASLAGHPTSNYSAYKYKKIIDSNRVSDYTGDGISDIAVFRPSTGEWIRQGSVMLTGWGGPGDIPLAGDYTGDGKSDIAVFRPSTGEWIRQGHVMLSGWGGPGDIPLSGDYTGDGITDIAVFRPATGEWIRQGHVMLTGWGQIGDIPLSGDYNGDGITDIAVFRPSTGEWIKQGAIMVSNWGEPGDIPLSGDYNGDGITDIAVYRPSNGSWIKLGAIMLEHWGNPTDLPTAGSRPTGSGSCASAMTQTAGPVC